MITGGLNGPSEQGEPGLSGAVSAPDQQGQARAKSTGSWVLAATILGSSMAFIDSTVVNVALPALQQGLHARATQMQWVVESYQLLLAALLLVGGVLGDRFGRRLVFVIGVVLFAVGSGWCGFARTVDLLIVARGLQGVGAALLVPGSLTLITAAFDESSRGKAIGTWSGFTAVTAAVGPVLGGWVVEHTSWRWVFFINIPIAVAVVIITQLKVPESRNEGAPEQLDWPGAALVTAGLGAVTFALIEGATHAGAVVWTAAIAGTLCLAGFLLVEARSAAPMVDLALFRSRNFSGANLLTLFLYAGLAGMLYFLPLNLIQVQHYSATAAGAALLPLIIMLFLLSRWAGGLTERYGARLPLIVGPTLAAIGFALGALPGLGGSYWTTVFPAMIVLGIGMALSVAPLTTAVMNSMPEQQAGVASGVNNAISRIAGLLSVAVFGLLLYGTFSRTLDHRLDALNLSPQVRRQAEAEKPKVAGAHSDDPRIEHAFAEAFISGYRLIVWVSAGLSLASALSAALLLEHGPTKKVARRREPALPA